MIADLKTHDYRPRRKQTPGRNHERLKDFYYRTVIIRLPSGWYEWRLLDEFGNLGSKGRERKRCQAAVVAGTVREMLHAELVNAKKARNAECGARSEADPLRKAGYLKLN